MNVHSGDYFGIRLICQAESTICGDREFPFWDGNESFLVNSSAFSQKVAINFYKRGILISEVLVFLRNIQKYILLNRNFKS